MQLEILAELRDQAEERLDLIQSEKIPDVIPLIEPPYITRLKNELEKLLTQLTKLAGDCETATKQKRLSSKIRVKWIWEKPKVNTLCERARRVREYLHAAIDMLEKRATL